ncbi:S-layer homology domain-containing protein [Paenibacillus sp. DMB5]|uniref:S-layer homology domain-containing protein n=1 Tax=Paenibacillus sp. DMB5 TaxID=1780103 RepID=UPI00076C40E0|nr:S-layer homology domain-containing protein [Paenibacillus sp. DMB5]KUP20886.1 hypothetical protein AWJ19_06365 [Paenibacillus sp. DMB5]
MFKLNDKDKTHNAVKVSSLLLTAALVLQPLVPVVSADSLTSQDNNAEQQNDNSVSVSENVYAMSLLDNDSNPVLTAEGDNLNNLVKLSWTSSKAGEEYYRVFQKDTGSGGLDEYQSIPLKTDIKVLNVYPDIPESSGLQDWMQTYGNPNGYSMQVDEVAISDFNGNDATKNYAKYLAKNADGSYPYDVLYFGAWDVNYGRDLSQASYEAVDAFIQYGGGVLVGHDTASFAHTYFIKLAQDYLNMDIKFQEGWWNPDIPPVGSNQVLIQRRGFPMNYPYALGDVGTILYTPTSHSYYQFARGDIWFKYTNMNWGGGQELTTYNGRPGTNNFYLTTWNNAAMIQTGHSNGQATEDEQKILANTLFYLSQISTANHFDDRMSQDVAAPNTVSGEVTVTPSSTAGKVKINWKEAEDNGSSYSYYLKTISFTDASSIDSTETTATVTTGIKGYAVSVDTDSSDIDPGNEVNSDGVSIEVENLERGVTYYAHIKTVDNASNVSTVYTIPFTTNASGLTVTSTDPARAINDGKTKLAVAEKSGQGNKFVYMNFGSSNVEIPGIGDELTSYTDMPTDGLVTAANGDLIGVAEVDVDGRVVRFGQVVAKSIPSPALLAVTSVDPTGVENDGKTRLVASVGNGNKLVYINYGKGELIDPVQGEEWMGYTDLPDGGIIGAAVDDKIGVAEIGADGKVLRFGVTDAKVLNEVQAKGLAANITYPTGQETEGKTKVAVSASSGNKIVYINFKKGRAVIPNTGSNVNGLDYEELPANGLVEAEEGDLLGLAEVDSAGNVVRYVTAPAVVLAGKTSNGLVVGTKEIAGNTENTQLTGSVDEGNKLVYMNLSNAPATPLKEGQQVGKGYIELPAGGVISAKNGDLLSVVEVDENGMIVKYGTTRAKVTSTSAPEKLIVTAIDPFGSGTDNHTQIVSKAADGNKLVYVNFGVGKANIPTTGDKLNGYVSLPSNGVIPANNGDIIGVAELGPDGTVLKYDLTEAVVIPERAAKNLPVQSSDLTGTGTEGKSTVKIASGTTVGAGNKLVYVNTGDGKIAIPEIGTILNGYTDVPENGQIEASNGDNIGIAEVDSSGKIVRFGTTKAVVENESAAKGLTASAIDPTGVENDNKTKITVEIKAGTGNKFVYLNFVSSPVASPNVGATLNGYSELPASGLIHAANGDTVGIAEIDEAGKVVKFGWVVAVSYAETAAKVLTVASIDPDGSDNDGKTQIQANATEGLKLVYVNFGTRQVPVPNTGELLAGYAELPENGIIPAINGDNIAVAEIDANGLVVRFGTTIAKVSDYIPNSNQGINTTAPSTKAPGVIVLVNGKEEYVGTADITSENGRTVTTINADETQLKAKLDAEGSGVVVTIPWKETSDIIIGQLSGQIVQQMQEKTATLVLDTPAGAYKIPMSQINLAALAGQLGQNIASVDVNLELHIEKASQEAVQAAERMATKAGVTLVASPVTFSLFAVHGDNSVEITDYSVYVERTIVLPANVDLNKITTGTVLEKDGRLRHVPTKILKEDEVYIAKINSLTNSDYGVIWNPVELVDVANHWSKNAVNDMASRLVVNGVGGGKYNPNADITRAEFAAIMVRGLGLRLDEGQTSFKDVDVSAWYSSAVNTASKYGLISGYEDGSFRPQQKITRQEAMTIIARMMKITGLKAKLENSNLSSTLLAFKDAGTIADWAKEGVTLSVAAQIVNGRTADSLAASSYITRAEVAAIIQRLLQKSDLI